MNLDELKEKHFQDNYLFNPEGYGRIYAFVDFGNVRHWAKHFWPTENTEHLVKEVDIRKLGEIIDFIHPVKKYFYYGHFAPHPGVGDHYMVNIRHKGSLGRLIKAEKCGFVKRTKEVKEISNFDEEGKYVGKISKCNFDVEIAMDVILELENYDTILLWSGDSDFYRLLQHLKLKRKKVIVVCARDFMSRELDEISDLYIPADVFKDHLEFIKPVQQATLPLTP